MERMKRRMENHGTSETNPPTLSLVAGTIEVGSLFKRFTARIEKKDVL